MANDDGVKKTSQQKVKKPSGAGEGSKNSLSRRNFIKASVGVAGGLALSGRFSGFNLGFAQDYPALGNFPRYRRKRGLRLQRAADRLLC